MVNRYLRWLNDRKDRAAADVERAAVVIARLRAENADFPDEMIEKSFAMAHARLALQIAQLRLTTYRELPGGKR